MNRITIACIAALLATAATSLQAQSGSGSTRNDEAKPATAPKDASKGDHAVSTPSPRAGANSATSSGSGGLGGMSTSGAGTGGMTEGSPSGATSAPQGSDAKKSDKPVGSERKPAPDPKNKSGRKWE